jgi:hypothetical protein
MPIGSGRVGGFGVKATPGIKGPHRGFPWRSPAFSRATPPVPALTPIQVIDWTTTSSIPSQLSFSRTGGATYSDNTGTIQTAASGVARFDNLYNGTAWIQAGLLIEEQRTNLVINTDISSAAWTPGHTTLSTDGTLSPSGGLAQLLTFDAFTVSGIDLYADGLRQGGNYWLVYICQSSGWRHIDKQCRGGF